MQGPSVKKLIARKLSLLAVPDGGGLQSAISVLLDREKLSRLAKEATDWVNAAIRAVKSAPDCRWETDEEIAEEILKAIERKEHGS